MPAKINTLARTARSRATSGVTVPLSVTGSPTTTARFVTAFVTTMPSPKPSPTPVTTSPAARPQRIANSRRGEAPVALTTRMSSCRSRIAMRVTLWTTTRTTTPPPSAATDSNDRICRTPASRNGNAAISGVPGGGARPVGTVPAVPPSASKTMTLVTPSCSTVDVSVAYHHVGRIVSESPSFAASLASVAGWTDSSIVRDSPTNSTDRVPLTGPTAPSATCGNRADRHSTDAPGSTAGASGGIPATVTRSPSTRAWASGTTTSPSSAAARAAATVSYSVAVAVPERSSSRVSV